MNTLTRIARRVGVGVDPGVVDERERGCALPERGTLERHPGELTRSHRGRGGRHDRRGGNEDGEREKRAHRGT